MSESFYRDPVTVGRYLRHRHTEVSSPNLVMEEPALRKALGSLDGLRVADLGCGDASIARSLLTAGAVSYLGVDSSEPMLSAARASLADLPGVRLEEAAIESFTPDPSSLDLIVSRLALHYVADLARVLDACASGLGDGGRLVFTVVHPVITSAEAVTPAGQPRTSWLVDDYFSPGPRARTWLGSNVTWQHRTVGDYVTALLHSGFSVTGLSECAPVRELFAGDQAEFSRRLRVPLFLLVAGQLR